MSFPTNPTRPSVTTTNLRAKGFLCHGCRGRFKIVGRDADNKLKCNDCLPASRRSLVELAEDD